MSELHVDVVIIGGGIAGLWTLNRLCNQGYNAILLENKALGSEQTLASQGMIHGGIKYTLGGALTGASEAIAHMPDHWRACLNGKGDVDLRQASLLSDHFYLWSTGGLRSRFGGFMASKATRGRVDNVAKSQRPAIFKHPDFSGNLYKLVDMVVDTPSLVTALANNYPERIFSIDWQSSHWQKQTAGTVSLDTLALHTHGLSLSAAAFVFTAGKGNEKLLNDVAATAPKTQRRPLQQVMVRHRYPHTFYGHCTALDTTPRLTISSHPMADGSQVWYLGGSLAEQGANQSPEQLIAQAQQELKNLLPWVDLGEAQWQTLAIDRAEPRQPQLMRPDQAVACWAEGEHCANIMAAWPTKLTLAPNMANQVSELLRQRKINPSATPYPLPNWPSPPISPSPWAEAFL